MKILQRMVAALLLVASSPFLFLIAAAIWLDSDGSPLYWGLRVGLNGKLFPMCKFRTMRDGAEQEGLETVKDDPRITVVGSFLRPCHLDELPQLWNVLMGDMDFAGPRPQVPGYYKEVADTADYEACLSVPPGMTGRAQLLGQSWAKQVGKAAQISVEARYAREKCLRVDFDIICDTPPVMFARKSI